MENEFIDKVLLPYCKGYTNTNINIALFHLDGTLLYTTPMIADNMSIPMEKLLGIAYKNATPEIIKQACEINDAKDINSIMNIVQQIGELHDIIIKDKVLINYIDFIPYKNYEAHLVNYFPVFDNNGEVVAAQMMSAKFYLFGIADYLNELKDKNHLTSLQTKTKGHLILPERQHEVLFLLLSGMNQNEIALFLDLSRGSISRIIGRLCAKFDIDGINTELLMKRTRKLHLHEVVPKSLNKPRIIILDPHIRQRVSKKN